jgi:predicted RNA-binding Zn ribbon-like protein
MSGLESDPQEADEATPTGSAGGADLALDLLNTLGPLEGSEGDRLGRPADVLDWLDAHGLARERVASLRASPAEAALLLTEVRRLRDELARALDAFRGQRTLSPAAVYGIDRLLRAGRVSRRLRAVAGRAELVEEVLGTVPAAVLAPVALAAAELLTRADPRRVRRCAAPNCGAWFLDTSKGGRRKWCSMATCGNRAKAAKHRKRRRAGSADTG